MFFTNYFAGFCFSSCWSSSGEMLLELSPGNPRFGFVSLEAVFGLCGAGEDWSVRCDLGTRV